MSIARSKNAYIIRNKKLSFSPGTATNLRISKHNKEGKKKPDRAMGGVRTLIHNIHG